MSAEVISEFLYALGWKVDGASQGKALRSVGDYEKAVVAAEKRVDAARLAGAKGEQQRARVQADLNLKNAKAALDSAKRREEAEEAAAKAAKERASAFAGGLAAMAAAAVAAATATTYAFARITGGMEQMLYSAKRSDSSVGGLGALGYAASQLGSSAEEAIGSVEALGQRMRAYPGYATQLRSLGIALTNADGSARKFEDVFLDIGDALNKMPIERAIAFAEHFGISERQMLAMRESATEMRRLKAEYEAMQKAAGLDPEDAARQAKAFQDSWRRVGAAVTIVTQSIVGKLSSAFGGTIDRFTGWLLQNAERISDAVVTIGKGILGLVDRIKDLYAAFDRLSPAQKDALVQLAALAGAFLVLGAGPLGALVAITGALVAFLDEEKLKKLSEMWQGFDKLARSITGQSGLAVAFEALAAVLALKLLAPLTGVVRLLGLLTTVSVPAWLLRVLGISGTAAAAVAAGTLGADMMTPNAEKPGLQKHWDDEAAGAASGGGAAIGRAWGWVKRKLGFGGGKGGAGAGDPGPAPAGLLDNIARAEGTAGRPDKGYNTSLGYGRFLPGGAEQDLTSKSLREILDLGTYMRQQPGNPNSSALGRYQIVGSTLKDAAAALNMDLDKTKFSAETQDKMAHWIARRQGLGAWEGFKGRPNERVAAQAALDRNDTAAGGTTQPVTGSKEVVGGAHPLDGGGQLSSDYGMRQHPIHDDMRMHKGIDLKAPAGTNVKSMTDGVVSIGSHGDITVKQADGSSTVYRHVVPTVADGARVAAGQLIAQLKASDPRSTGPHLHFEARDAKGSPYDPKGLLAPKPKPQPEAPVAQAPAAAASPGATARPPAPTTESPAPAPAPRPPAPIMASPVPVARDTQGGLTSPRGLPAPKPPAVAPAAWSDPPRKRVRDIPLEQIEVPRAAGKQPSMTTPPAPPHPPAPTFSIDPEKIRGAEKALEGFSNRFNEYWKDGNTEKNHNPFKAMPLGSWSNNSVSNIKNVTINAPTNVTASGMGDGKDLAKSLAPTQGRVHADLLRNVQGAVA